MMILSTNVIKKSKEYYHDHFFINIIKENTDKNVITVNAENVCYLGGNVRCLSWQLTGDNAKKLIESARKY